MTLLRSDILAASDTFHVFSRGVERRPIFRSVADQQRFQARLFQYLEDHRIDLFCACLKRNHFHLVIRCRGPQLSVFLHRLLTAYAMYFNRKYGRVGHLFQGRFQSRAITNEAYLRTVISYVQQNAVGDSSAWLLTNRKIRY